MAFDNLQFRSCSYNYNHNGFADDPSFISQATKDIGNDAGSPATNNCLKFELSPLNTVWNDDVTVSAQVEVYFQALAVADSSGNTTADSPSWLSKVPVEQRQGLFRLPRYYSADGSITKTVYRAYKENDGLYYLYIDTNVVKGLHKTTRTDGSVILGYPPAVPEGDATLEGSPVTDLYYPQPTTSDEFTIKRLTHSITDFVTYQAGGQLTSNILNFQKEQEMYLIQELLWTIEMDMLTFSDLSGLGSIVTAGNDGTIDPEQIRLSLYQLTDTQSAEGANSHVVLYKDQVGDDWTERQKNNLLAYNDLTDVTINSDTLTGGHVVFYDSTSGWINGTINDAADSCTEKSASVLKMCADSVSSNQTVGLNGILINNGSNTFDVTSDTTLVTSSGLAKVPLTTLSNVTVPSPSTNDVLYWSGSTWANIAVGSLTSGILGPAGGDTFFFDLVYNNTSAPASGKIILLQSGGSAATTWASVAEIQVNTTDKDSAAISSWLDSLDDGSSAIGGNIKIFNKAAPEQYGIFNLTSVTGTSSTRSLSVTHVSSNTNPSANMEVYLTMSYKGDQGDRGPAGTDGTDGQDGSQGLQGIGFAETGATCQLVNSNQDLKFEFPRENPAGGSALADTEVTCTGIGAAVGVEILYVQSFQINPSGFGFYNYVLNTAADGSGTSYNAINAMEEHNTGAAASNRIFNGITFSEAAGAGDLTRITGVDTVTNDTIRLYPAGNNAPTDSSSTTAAYKLQVLCKTQSATKNSFAYTRIFSVANAIRTIQCG